MALSSSPSPDNPDAELPERSPDMTDVRHVTAGILAVAMLIGICSVSGKFTTVREYFKQTDTNPTPQGFFPEASNSSPSSGIQGGSYDTLPADLNSTVPTSNQLNTPSDSNLDEGESLSGTTNFADILEKGGVSPTPEINPSGTDEPGN